MQRPTCFLYNCQTTKPCATDCAKQESRLFAYNINNNKNKTTKQKQKQPFYCDPKACPASLQLHFLKNQKCLNFHRSQLFTPLFLKLKQSLNTVSSTRFYFKMALWYECVTSNNVSLNKSATFWENDKLKM